MCNWISVARLCLTAVQGQTRRTATAAIKQACDTLIHAHSSYFNVQEIRLAERLAGVMPAGVEKSLFPQSGSDANEAGGMIAPPYTGGYEVAGPPGRFPGLSATPPPLSFARLQARH